MTIRYAAAAFLALPVFTPVRGNIPQVPPAGSGEPATPFKISVNLNLIILPTTVHDRKGGFASDLTEGDFQVFENGARQTIRVFRHDDIPVTVGLVVDHSGSMRKKLPDVVAAARTFVHSSNPEDQMFVVNFNDRVSLGLPEGLAFSDRADQLEAAVGKIPAEGQTTLYDAISLGLDQLKSGNREKRALIVISDGGDNASTLDLAGILRKASASNALVYTIGIFDPDDPDQKPGVLRRLARETGGEAYFPAEFSDVIAICDSIASDIRHQYTIGYVSGSAKNGGYRSVRVVAKAAGKDLVVRTRTGYIAQEASR
jgi:VWFA-related protein